MSEELLPNCKVVESCGHILILDKSVTIMNRNTPRLMFDRRINRWSFDEGHKLYASHHQEIIDMYALVYSMKGPKDLITNASQINSLLSTITRISNEQKSRGEWYDNEK